MEKAEEAIVEDEPIIELISDLQDIQLTTENNTPSIDDDSFFTIDLTSSTADQQIPTDTLIEGFDLGE